MLENDFVKETLSRTDKGSVLLHCGLYPDSGQSHEYKREDHLVATIGIDLFGLVRTS
jgi:hypothetical protein